MTQLKKYVCKPENRCTCHVNMFEINNFFNWRLNKHYLIFISYLGAQLFVKRKDLNLKIKDFNILVSAVLFHCCKFSKEFQETKQQKKMFKKRFYNY